MNIVILGNGFDLANGLPTSYDDFFLYRFKDITNKYGADISDEFEKFIQLFTEPFVITTSSYINFNVNDTTRLKAFQINTNNGPMDYFQLNNKFCEFVNVLIKNDVSFFDVYFTLNKANNSEWNNIESEIYKIVKAIPNYSSSTYMILLDKMLTGNMHTNVSEKESRIKELFLKIYIEKTKNDNLSNYEYFLCELKKFENNFKNYISIICRSLIESQYNKNRYVDNFNKLLGTYKNAYIINFNYTSIESFSVGLQKNFTTELNVHGRFDYCTIFGIDTNSCDNSTDEFIFSKTYRKISEDTQSEKLPRNISANIDEQNLIFFGHSLSKPDYSYFQSLFDLYDIYNQTNLIFKYSIYEMDKSEEIKSTIFKNVTRLIMDYGTSMDNKDHGKNLLHKILLEGRLKLEIISLDKLEFDHI